MGANSESDILNALNGRLSSLIGHWPVAWPNISFVPPSDGKYLRASFQPNQTRTYSLDNSVYEMTGLYQVSVVSPSDSGLMEMMEQASSIVRQFDYLTRISTASGPLLIPRMPTVSGGLRDGPSYEMAVTIRYQLITN